MTDSDWHGDRRFVIEAIKRLEREIEKSRGELLDQIEKNRSELLGHFDDALGSLRNDMQVFASATRSETVSMKIQIAMLQVKSGVWGVIGGAVTVAIGLALKHFG